MYAVASNDGCKGDSSNIIQTKVLNPLSMPQVNCGTLTSKSVEFIWDALPGATGYEVSVNGAEYTTPSAGITALSHAISGFNPNTSISINVIAKGNLPCGNSLPSSTKTCTTSANNNITCTPVNYFISSEQSVCKGDSLELNISNLSSTKYSINWNGLSTSKSLSYKFAPTKDTSVLVSVIDSNQNIACAATAKKFNVLVKPLPLINLTSSAYHDSICEGSLISFTAIPSGYDSYEFYSGYQLMQEGSNHNYETNNWTNDKPLSLVATNQGCKSYFNDTIFTKVVSPLAKPQVNVGATNSSSVEFLWDSIPGATSYKVSVNNAGFISPSSGSNGLKHLVSGLSIGDKTSIVVLAQGYGPCGIYSESVDGFTGISGNGENTITNDTTGSQPSDTVSIITTNDICPALTYEINPYQSVCSGQQINLEINNISIVSSSISWNNNPYANLNSFIIVPSKDTVIVVKVKNTALTNCPVVNKFFEITVKDIPSISLISSAFNDSICKGDSITFTAVPAGFDTYDFYDGYALKQNVANPKFVTTNLIDGHSIYVIPENQGCIGDTSNIITTRVLNSYTTPEVNCGVTTSNSIEFIWDSIPGAAAYYVSVNGSGFDLSNGGLNSFSHFITGINPNTSVSLSVYAKGNSLCGKSLVSITKTCKSTGNSSIICNPVGFDITSNQSICKGDSLSLNVSGIKASNYSISWNNGQESLSNSYKIAPKSDTLVSVSIKNLDQNSTCPAEVKYFNIEVKALPETKLISSINNDSICKGQKISFTAVPVGYDSYDFYRGYLLLQSSDNPVYSTDDWVDGKSITVIAKHMGCTEISNKKIDTIKTTVVSPLLSPQVNCGITTHNSITFTWDSVPNAQAYLVSADGGTFVSPSSGKSGLSHFIGGLNQNTSHTLQVIALGKSPCGNSSVSATAVCRTTSDPAVSCNGVTFKINPEQAVCKGEQAKLTLSKISALNYSINWNGSANINDTVYSFICSKDTSISVSVKNNDQPGCPETIKRFIISVKQNPAVVLTSSIAKDSICEGDNLTYIASPAGYDKYSFYDGNTLLKASDYHKYDVANVKSDMKIKVLTENAGCYSSSDTKNLIMVSKPIISLTDNMINSGICLGDTFTVKASPENHKSYIFYDNEKILKDSTVFAYSFINVTSPHAVKAKAVNYFGCISNFSNVISNKVHALPLVTITSSDNDNKICDNESVTFTLSPAKLVNYTFYSNDSIYQSSSKNQLTSSSLSNEQGFYAIATDSNQCISAPTKTLITFVNPIPNPSLQADLEGLCIGSKANLAVVLDEANFPGITYLWSDGQTNKKIVVTPKENTSYYLTANYKGCKSAIDTIKLKVDQNIPVANAGDDITICPGDSVQLNASGGMSYVWDDLPGLTSTDIANPKASPKTSFTYKLTVYNEYCFDSDEISITIDRCLKDIPEPIPQVISPNGDGANDFWEIKDVDYFSKNNLTIYNRWGNKVYAASPYDNTWSGKSTKGNDLPDGTYYFVLDLGIDKQPYVGFIILSR